MKKILWIYPKHLKNQNYFLAIKKKFKSIKIKFVEGSDTNQIFQQVKNATILINCPSKLFNRKLISKAKKLDWVHFGGAGVEPLLFRNFIKSKIQLTNGKIIQGPEVAEHAISLMLYFNRNLGSFLNKKKIFNRPVEILNKKCGIIGGGGIGLCLAEKLKSFGAKTRIFDDKLIPLLNIIDEYFDSSEILNNISDLDYLFSAAPLTKYTNGLINSGFLKKMKRGSILINVSRGKIIKTKDLLKNKLYKKFKGIALDVTDPEPLPHNDTLRSIENIIITNHTAGLSDKNRARSYRLIETNIKRYLLKRPLLNIVDKERGF